MNELKDKSLSFIRIAQGDKQAFDDFFHQYYPCLVRYTRAIVHCEQQAEDIVADVLTNLLARREKVFALPHFEAYLYTSVRNKAITFLKRRKDTAVSSTELRKLTRTTGSAASPYELLVEEELDALARRVIQNLPPKRRRAFQLFRERNLSYRQVADAMHISERTVEVHLRMAVKTLRRAVEDYLDQKEAKRSAVNLSEMIAPLLVLFIL